ncbi:hypothetical protein JCM11491_004902 [Sporobolomyces phaffii]
MRGTAARQEGGALPIWFAQYSGPSSTPSEETIDHQPISPNAVLSTPETPSLSLPASLTASPVIDSPRTPFLEPDSLFRSPGPRSRSQSSFPSLPSDHHAPTCGGLGLFLPSLSHRSSTPELRPSSRPPTVAQSPPYLLGDEDDWEHFPPSPSIPTNQSRNAQRYAPPIEEGNALKRLVWTKPDVRARPGYRGLRRAPPVPGGSV